MDHAIQSARDEVLATQYRFWQALRTKDQTLFEDVLAPEFIARSPGEADQTRESLIAILIGSSVTVGEITGDEIEVHFFSDLAVLSGVQVAFLYLPSGVRQYSWVTLTNIFRRDDDQQWRMIFSFSHEHLEP
jgi:ketosteroid isomerase-like protein